MSIGYRTISSYASLFCESCVSSCFVERVERADRVEIVGSGCAEKVGGSLGLDAMACGQLLSNRETDRIWSVSLLERPLDPIWEDLSLYI